MTWDSNGYIDCRTRLVAALKDWPDLRVVEEIPEIVKIGERHFIQATVTLFRTIDDALPVRAYNFEPFPGKTNFTRDSEQQNSSTSALARALGYMGFGIKSGLASADEVRTAKGNSHNSRESQTVQESSVTYLPKAKRNNDEPCTEKQQSYIMALCKKHKQTSPDFLTLTKTQANDIIDHLKGLEQ